MSEERLTQLEREQQDLKRRFAEAFPGGDHVGHCRYHELMIEEIDERRKLRRAVTEKTVAGVVWGALVIAAIAIWQWFKEELRRP